VQFLYLTVVFQNTETVLALPGVEIASLKVV